MTQAGIAIPPGFVILADAFDVFIKEANLEDKIEEVLGKVKNGDTRIVDKASETIRALIMKAKMPGHLQDEILKSFKELGAQFVAVRSSATAEDAKDTSWAGELETYLNTTESTLLKNVQKCWGSLFTPRAIFYRFEKKLDKTKVSVAVVIQKMVNSEISGVAFSVHPVTQDKNQLIIEAGWGLGEAIVSGSVTPDSYIVDKRDLSILDINIAEQDKKIVRKKTGGNEWVSSGKEKSSQKLAGQQIIELSKMIVNIESHYGFPVDIEWAYEGGNFYITQSRPITTL